MQALNFYKCLADHNRLKIMLLLTREGELCVCELMDYLSEIQPKISRNLAQLKHCGLIQHRREGQWMYYSLHDGLPEWCKETLQLALLNDRNFLQQEKTTFADLCA